MTIPLVDPKDKLLEADFLMEVFTASVFWGEPGSPHWSWCLGLLSG